MMNEMIANRYVLVQLIGEGGMASVYLAVDTILKREVAIKILRGELAKDPVALLRFQREANATTKLSHPNIVEVYDVGEDNGLYYIVMEYIEGKHLKQLIKKRGNLTVREVVDIMTQLTDGMSAAHDSYIIHRDIKPQNIMILENGMIKITIKHMVFQDGKPHLKVLHMPQELFLREFPSNQNNQTPHAENVLKFNLRKTIKAL